MPFGAARLLAGSEARPLVLNMANPDRPGGSFIAWRPADPETFPAALAALQFTNP